MHFTDAAVRGPLVTAVTLLAFGISLVVLHRRTRRARAHWQTSTLLAHITVDLFVALCAAGGVRIALLSALEDAVATVLVVTFAMGVVLTLGGLAVTLREPVRRLADAVEARLASRHEKAVP